MLIATPLFTSSSSSSYIDSMVRGYYIYKEVWEAAVGEELECKREVNNVRTPGILLTVL